MVFRSNNNAFTVDGFVKRPNTWGVYAVVVGEDDHKIWSEATHNNEFPAYLKGKALESSICIVF
jgi:hypothetical protein